MGFPYHALYLDLLDDLSEYLPLSIVGQKSAAAYEDWYPDMTPKQFSAVHLSKSFYKKLVDGTPESANEAAQDKFLQSNVRCRDWSLAMERLEDEYLIGNFRKEMYDFFTVNGHSLIGSLAGIMQDARVGPGASIQSRGTDFYTKLFSGPLSCTSKGIYELYSSYVKNDPMWDGAERLRSLTYGDYSVVEGNRLSFVPKNVDTSRVICTEPVLNMFLQLGIGGLIEKRINRFFGIDLATQPDINRDLAQLGSLHDNLCTIDLASASDSVSMSMLEQMLPVDIVNWLRFVRSPTVTLPDGRVEELHMVSSMGNGFTFPLQTAIFACVVSAAHQTASVHLKRPSVSLNGRLRKLCNTSEPYAVKELGNFGVFGDDIIIKRVVYKKVVRLLNLLGFQVNAEKSFYEGPFRESCGGDFFRGHPVRGVYIKSLRTQANRFVAINRLNEWSAMTGIYLPKTVARLLKKTRFLPVPLWENNDAGVRVPMSLLRKRMMHKDYQSLEYKRWQSVPQGFRVKDEKLVLPRTMRSRIYNPDGLLLACLRGDVVNGTIGSRTGPVKYRTKVAIAPNWDHLQTIGKQLPIGQGQFATAIVINLNR